MSNRNTARLCLAFALAASSWAASPAMAQDVGKSISFEVFSCSVEFSLRSNTGPVTQQVTLSDDITGRRVDISSPSNVATPSVASYSPTILHLFVAPDLFDIIKGYALHSTQIQAGISIQPQADGTYRIADMSILMHDPIAARCPSTKANP